MEHIFLVSRGTNPVSSTRPRFQTTSSFRTYHSPQIQVVQPQVRQVQPQIQIVQPQIQIVQPRVVQPQKNVSLYLWVCPQPSLLLVTL